MPLLPVLAIVAFQLFELHPTLRQVAYLDDSSVHEQMVRFAAKRLALGHSPLTSWFPYLGLGSPQYLHYQNLPSIVTGAVGIVTGPNHAFVWSLYLLLATWPLSIYCAARLFRLTPRAAAAAAVLAPFVASAVGVGYEQAAYVWTGYGLWTQLWAMWALPIAWGCSWRFLVEGRWRTAAVLATSATIAFHFETGYLAALPVLLLPLLRPSWRRFKRAAGLAVLVLLCTSWVTVPLLASAPWASVNEPLRHTPLERGYGAAQMLAWLFTGRFLDDGRLPILTGLAALGALVVATRRRKYPGVAAATALGLASFVLSWGPTTFGILIDAVPGHADLFFRRFAMGMQVSAVLLAGLGLDALLGSTARLARRRGSRLVGPIAAPEYSLGRDDPAAPQVKVTGGVAGHAPTGSRWSPVGRVLGVALVAALLLPLVVQYRWYEGRNRAHILVQAAADARAGRQVNSLLDIVKNLGGGRVYAGLPTNWGASFTVGMVALYQYLEWRDIDEVGYLLRTASLMTDPEYEFDQANPGDYAVFGIRYLLLPTAMTPPVSASLVAHQGPYALWELPGNGYLRLGSLVGTVRENKGNVGNRSISYLQSSLPTEASYHQVLWPRGAPPVRHPPKLVPGDAIRAQHVNLIAGTVSATVALTQPALLVLSASYDPGWHATVDRRAARTLMLSPALVGVVVPAGTHRVTFNYVGFAGYPPLLVLAGTAVIAVVVLALATQARLRRSARSLRGDGVVARCRNGHAVGCRDRFCGTCGDEPRRALRPKASAGPGRARSRRA